MKTKDVWYNQGRWLVRCPICKQKNQIKPKKGDKEIKWYCGGCYPDKIKRIPKPLPTGVLTYGYDRKAQIAAAQKAYEYDEIHTAILPRGWQSAEKLLRKRRLPHQGWYPGDFDPPNNKKETLKELRDEQKNHPDLFYLQKEKKDKKLPAQQSKPKKRRDKIPPDLYRSLQ